MNVMIPSFFMFIQLFVVFGAVCCRRGGWQQSRASVCDVLSLVLPPLSSPSFFSSLSFDVFFSASVFCCFYWVSFGSVFRVVGSVSFFGLFRFVFFVVSFLLTMKRQQHREHELKPRKIRSSKVDIDIFEHF